MRRLVLIVIGLSVSSCTNDVIGVSCPEGGEQLLACSQSDAGPEDEFDVSFLDIESSPRGELHEVWRRPRTCSGCDGLQSRLFPAQSGAAWQLVTVDGLPWLEKIDAEQTVLSGVPMPSPSARPFEYRTTDGFGGVLTHRRLANGSAAMHEVEHVDRDFKRSSVLLATGRRGAPMNLSATHFGYLAYASAGDPQALRLFDPQGQAVWSFDGTSQRGFLSGGAALAVGDRFVVSADGHPKNDDFKLGLLWLEQDGTYEAFRMPRGVSWRSTRFHRLSNEEVLVIAESHVPTLSGDDERDLDIVRFRGPAGPEPGVRLKQNCFHGVRHRGSTLGDSGDVLISTVTGQNATDTHAMICRVPLTSSASARCYGPPSRDSNRVKPPLLEDIVAVGPNSVLAISDAWLLRVDLVEPSD